MFCDIGVNLVDDMYLGIYHGKQKHAEDIAHVLQRAQDCGVKKSIITGTNLDESLRAIEMCRNFQGYDLYCTVGVHPTQCCEMVGREEDLIAALRSAIEDGSSDGRVVALGECGLDYDRLQFCSKEVQIVGFMLQLDLAATLPRKLPLFLHNRNTEGDFLRVISENIHKLPKGGVVHSFDGSLEEMNALVDLGLYIGVNGCSLKTEENLKVVAEIPDHLLLLETDAPWCGVKASHAGHKFVKTTFPAKKPDKYSKDCLVKDRNEPCTMTQICEIVAAVKEVQADELAATVWANTERLFFSP